MTATETIDATKRQRLPVVALLTANAVSVVGNQITAIAVPWFVLETTGSATRTGLAAAFAFLPAFTAGLLGGTLVDRLGDKRVSIVSDVVSGLAVALIPLLSHTIGLAFWQLLLFVFLGALLDVPGLTARRSLLPELARAGRFRLERVNAAFEGIQPFAQLLGPPLAGLLIVAIGASGVLLIDAATFAFSALAVGLAVPSILVRTTAAGGRFLDELREGWRFLRGDAVLLWLALGLLITNGLGTPLFGVLMPVYAKERFDDPTVLGLMAAVFGGGTLLGSVAYGAFGHRLSRRRLWLAAFLVGPAMFWVFVPNPPLWVILLVHGLIGLVGGPTNPLLVTVRHERIPPALRGRVFSTFSAIAMAAAPLGLFVVGALVERIGFDPSLVALGAAYLVVGVGLVFVPALREMERRVGPGESTLPGPRRG